MRKQFLYLLLLGILCSIGNVWATDYLLINGNNAESTATLNTTDYWTTQSLSSKSNGGDYKKCIITAGTVSDGITNLASPTKYISYDIKTTATTLTIKVYNANSSDLKFHIYDVTEAANGTTTSTRTEKTAKTKELGSISYSTTRTAGEKGTIYIAVPSSATKLEFYQITAAETGTALTNITGGRSGYSVNYNKGRLAAKSGEVSKMDGIEYKPSGDSKATNTAYVQLKTSNYIKFTTIEPIVLTVTTQNAYKFYVATSIDGTTNEKASAATHKIKLTTADTWYIIGGASSATQVSSLSFSAAPQVTYNANGGSGSRSNTYFTVAANSFTAPSGKEFKEWNDDKDGNGTTYAEGYEIETSTTLYAIWQDAIPDVAPSIDIESSADAAVAKGAEVTLTAAATGHPTPTIQWYSNTENNSTSGTIIDGATETTYSPSTTTAGTMYYYAKATNNFGDEDHVATSNVVSVVVNKSAACELTKVSYSNGFDAFIKLGATNTITAYYLAGKDIPTISEVTISDDATYDVEGSTLTVTAEDGSTTKEFTITLSPVTPYSGTGTYNFDGTETWVKNAYGYDAGWKISKPVEENSNKRVSEGKCRMYFFLAPHTSLKMTNINTTRNVDVYKDGTTLGTVTFTQDEEKTITVNADDACMIGLVNKGNGDAKFGYVTITKSGFESGIISASGWNTFSSSSKLDLSQVTGATAYVATEAEGSTVTLKAVSDKIVAAGEGLMIKGTANAAFKIATTSDAATFAGENKLVGVTASTTVAASTEGAYHYVFGFNTASPSTCGFYNLAAATVIPAGKAYLATTEALSTGGPSAPAAIRIEDEENNATNIYNLDATDNAVKFFENGVLYILRDGIVYDALGRIVK